MNKELNVVNLVFDGGSVKELDEYCKNAKKQIAELEIYIENLKATIKSLKISQQKQIDELKLKDRKNARVIERLKQ